MQQVMRSACASASHAVVWHPHHIYNPIPARTYKTWCQPASWYPHRCITLEQIRKYAPLFCDPFYSTHCSSHLSTASRQSLTCYRPPSLSTTSFAPTECRISHQSLHISIICHQSYKNWACSICLPQAPACTSGSPSNWVCVASKQQATTQLEQQTDAEQPPSLNNKLSALPALCSHAFVPDSVAVHFWVHSVLGGASLQRSSLVMLVLVGLCLLARRALSAGEGNISCP